MPVIHGNNEVDDGGAKTTDMKEISVGVPPRATA